MSKPTTAEMAEYIKFVSNFEKDKYRKSRLLEAATLITEQAARIEELDSLLVVAEKLIKYMYTADLDAQDWLDRKNFLERCNKTNNDKGE